MNQDIKQMWVTALRSGEFKQARKALRTNEGYCCLGVLCELYSRTHGMPWGVPRNATGYHMFGDQSGLPPQVRDWSGVKHMDGLLPAYIEADDGNRTSLADLNDTGKSFAQIAEIIDDVWLDL